MKLADLPVRVVRPLDGPVESEEERSQRLYGYTTKWRDRNREKRNENDRKWRAKRKARE